MDALHEAVLAIDGDLAYLVIALLAFAEAAAFVGLLVPGELAVLVGGALAAQGRASLPVMIVVVAVAAVAGDSTGYEIGRRHGRRLLAWQPVDRRVGAHAGSAEAYMARRGGWVVFVGRWTGILRAVVPGVAGMVGMRYRTFLVWNVVGGVAWAAAFVTLGYVAGTQIERVAGWSAGLGLALVATFVAVRLVRARLARRGRPATIEAPERPAKPGTVLGRTLAGGAARTARPGMAAVHLGGLTRTPACELRFRHPPAGGRTLDRHEKGLS